MDVMQNDKVQKWVNSLPVQNGDDLQENPSAEDGSHLLSNGTAGDDMSLGAEAKCVNLGAVAIEETVEAPNEINNMMANGMVYPSSYSGMCNGETAAVQLLRQKFRIQQQDSFNSETSSHLTIDSIDQLLLERRGDPEKILENLGFVGKVVDKYHRIPERFLKSNSKAKGITVEKYLDDNPRLKEYLEMKAARQRPFEIMTLKEQPEEITDKSAEKSEAAPYIGVKKMTAFHEVASTLAMINRFRNLVRRINARDSPEPDVAVVEPILRNSNKGTKFWSILTLDNCSFLDRMGYYELQTEKLSKMKGGAAKFSFAANLMKKQMSGGNGLKATLSQEPASVTPSESDIINNNNANTAKLDKILHSRAAHAADKTKEKKEKTEKTPEKVDDAGQKDTRFSVPERFLTSQSKLFGSVKQLTGESVSEIVRRTSAGNFDFSEIPNLNISVPNVPNEPTTNDVYTHTDLDLPIIEINSVRESTSPNRCSIESFDYEWQRTSVSSAATEDSSFSDSDFDMGRPSALDSLNIETGLTVDDAASVLSSYTLKDAENTDPTSDQDTCTDTQQISQDSQLDNENISSDNLPPVVKFSSKIKDVLRRQGSSQSDSSGFVEYDHPDSTQISDSSSLNKVRYINRQTKLDAIYSQESTSMEDDTIMSSQCEFNQSQMSDVPNCLRILKGDFRREIWSSKVSVKTQTDWEQEARNQEEFNEIKSEDFCDSASFKERFHSQPEIFTTRLYIDSPLPNASIPLVERTEVMLILDANQPMTLDSLKRVRENDSQLRSVNHISSVDVEVLRTDSGNQHLTPILFSSKEAAIVRSEDHAFGRQYCDVHGNHDINERLFSVLPMHSGEYKEDFSKDKPFSMDVTNHHILHSLLKQSVFVSPQSAACLLPPSHWSTFGHAEISKKQHLVEEVKLLQHALQKYRLEMRVLQMQGKKLYMENMDHIHPEERNSLLQMEELREAILKELDDLDTQLSQRMKFVISSSSGSGSHDVDLSCISIIQQMIELLKEQLYHSNIISGMSTILSSCPPPSSDSQSSTKPNHDDELVGKIASLEKKIEEQNRTIEAYLSNTMKQIQEMMQHQVQGNTTVTPASSSSNNSF